MITAPDFRPPRGLRHPQLQTVLAARATRRRRWLDAGNRMEASARHHLLDAGDGVRLSGYHSPQARSTPRGLVLLIHGWEGSHQSVYLYSMACALFEAGYSVFRLNLRDHGDSHHLNRGMFHSARTAEVLHAIRSVRELDDSDPLFVVGFSLGGNFALRIGLHGPEIGLKPRLSVGICPAINPRATISAIDHGAPWLRWYFMKQWRRAVEAKARAWPEYRALTRTFTEPKRLLEITERFAASQTEYGAMEPYLDAYTLQPRQLLAAPSPLAIVTAADDPVIPVSDFHPMLDAASRDGLQLDITAHGGHCGFIENWALHSWAEKRVLSLIERAA